MATKIRIRVGDVEVEYEGAEAFLDKKLPDLISELSRIYGQTDPSRPEGVQRPGAEKGKEKHVNLASFLKKTNSHSSQWERFLATAEWLHIGGQEMLKTADISAALKQAKQKKLRNASDCRNKCVAKGFCEKDGNQFFVTDDGRKHLA